MEGTPILKKYESEEFGGWNEHQYIQFLEDEIKELSSFCARYREIYNNNKRQNKEPSQEFLYAAKQLSKLRLELRGIMGYDNKT